MILTHLTFVGPAAPAATVDFEPQLTLIHGPSDTGKSFIVNSISFMLGGRALKEIPEMDGYTTVLLGLRLPDDQILTLSRPIGGGKFGLFRSDVRSGPLPTPDQILSAKHSPNNDGNLSRYLLKQLELDNQRIRKNVRNATDMLSFRNLAHLCLVDETQMQSEIPPALTGQYVSRTKEISVLKLLLQAEDDSDLVEQEDRRHESRLDGARVEVIDRLLAQLEAKLSELPNRSELIGQLERLNASIEQRSRSVSYYTSQRTQATAQLRLVEQSVNEARSEMLEISSLQGRFNLLNEQYKSDLMRLETINEAGNLLDYFAPGVCPFCGAERDHQKYNLECEGEDTAIHVSIVAETAKTEALRQDLLATIDDLGQRRSIVITSGRQALSRLRELQARVQELDEQIAPQDSDLSDLLTIRRNIEKAIDDYARIEELEEIKRQIAGSDGADTEIAGVGVSAAAVREFSGEISKRLSAWGYPEAQSARYDRSTHDIEVGDQFRSSHGKGVRAILHAAFTLGLAQYCFDRDLAHPGFVVLDSPLVTYRPPDGDYNDVGILDEDLPSGVVQAFYQDLQADFGGQVIVMENLDPPGLLEPDSGNVIFTGNRGIGRYGFFPARSNRTASTPE